MKKAVTFTIDEGIIDRLRALSKETNIPQARLAQLALEAFISKEENKNGR